MCWKRLDHPVSVKKLSLIECTAWKWISPFLLSEKLNIKQWRSVIEVIIYHTHDVDANDRSNDVDGEHFLSDDVVRERLDGNKILYDDVEIVDVLI